MSSIVKNKVSEETHSWNHHVPPGATKLFIGTFPTEVRNRKHDFFYSSATNRFWEILAALVDIELNELNGENAVENRKKILKQLRLGLTDMGKKVLRQQGSSNDHSLFPLEFMDIFQILRDHPSIDTLIVSGGADGNSSLSWFATFCQLNNIPVNAKQIDKRMLGEVIIGGKSYNIIKFFSPSRLSRKKTEVLVSSYRTVILG